MTAFARTSFEGECGRAVWELRSVNHRYLEIFVRLPEDLRALESVVRDRVAARLKRGKIDCVLRFSAAIGEATNFSINAGMAERVVQAARTVSAYLDAAQPINPMDVLRYPGVLEMPEIDLERVSENVIAGLRLALDELAATRLREGAKLREFIADRCAAVEQQLGMLRRRVPEIIESIRERHEQRLREIAPDLDAGRLEQECALLNQRLDVAEELDRLSVHVQEVRRVLEQAQPIGRRLDFLMQEINREANTLGSKSAHADTANASVELKVLVEQMREQIQNVE